MPVINVPKVPGSSRPSPLAVPARQGATSRGRARKSTQSSRNPSGAASPLGSSGMGLGTPVPIPPEAVSAVGAQNQTTRGRRHEGLGRQPDTDAEEGTLHPESNSEAMEGPSSDERDAGSGFRINFMDQPLASVPTPGISDVNQPSVDLLGFTLPTLDTNQLSEILSFGSGEGPTTNPGEMLESDFTFPTHLAVNQPTQHPPLEGPHPMENASTIESTSMECTNVVIDTVPTSQSHGGQLGQNQPIMHAGQTTVESNMAAIQLATPLVDPSSLSEHHSSSEHILQPLISSRGMLSTNRGIPTISPSSSDDMVVEYGNTPPTTTESDVGPRVIPNQIDTTPHPSGSQNSTESGPATTTMSQQDESDSTTVQQPTQSASGNVSLEHTSTLQTNFDQSTSIIRQGDTLVRDTVRNVVPRGPNMTPTIGVNIPPWQQPILTATTNDPSMLQPPSDDIRRPHYSRPDWNQVHNAQVLAARNAQAFAQPPVVYAENYPIPPPRGSVPIMRDREDWRPWHTLSPQEQTELRARGVPVERLPRYYMQTLGYSTVPPPLVQAPVEEGLGFYPTPYGLAHGYLPTHGIPQAVNTVEQVTNGLAPHNMTTSVNVDKQVASALTPRSTSAAVNTDVLNESTPSKTTAVQEPSSTSKKRRTGDADGSESTHSDTTIEILRMLQNISNEVKANARATAYHAQLLYGDHNTIQEENVGQATLSPTDVTPSTSTLAKGTQPVDKTDAILESLSTLAKEKETPTVKIPSTANISHMNVDKFNGHACRNTKHWIEHFENTALAMGASPLRAFSVYCDPNVYRTLRVMEGIPTFQMVSPEQTEDMLWEEIKTTLHKCYVKKISYQTATLQLTSRHQRAPEENVSQFAGELIALASQIEPPWPKSRIAEIFMENMDPAVSSKMGIIKGTESFHELLELAQLWEQKIRREQEKVLAREATGMLSLTARTDNDCLDERIRLQLAAFSRPKASVFNKPPIVKRPIRLSDSNGTRRDFKPRTPKPEGEPPWNGNFRCVHCGKRGHPSKFCRAKAAGSVATYDPRRTPESDKVENVKLCSYSAKTSALVKGYVRNSDRNYIYSPMLADSGADADFVSERMVRRLGLKIDPETAIEYKDGSDRTCRGLGTVILTVRLHLNVSFRTYFQVIPACPHDIILGPALAIHRGWFDFYSRTLKFPGEITIPSANPTPFKFDDIPNVETSLATFAGEEPIEYVDPDFADDSRLTSVLQPPTAAEVKALEMPGGNAPKQFPNIDPSLPPEMQAQMRTLVQKYFDRGLFNQPCNSDREKRGLPFFRIKVKDGTEPSWRRRGRPVWSQETLIEETVQQYLTSGIIMKSDSLWSAMPFVVNGKRVVIDFRILNQATIFEKFDTHDIRDILDRLGVCEYISIGDLSKAYHQFFIHPDDRHFTAFSTPSGHYHFLVVPFGLAGAPGFFNKMMSIALAGILNNWAFFDDISTGTVADEHHSAWENHLIALEQQFEALMKYNLKLDPSKCFYGYKKLNVLGFEVHAGKGVSFQDKQIEPILNMKAPNTKTSLKSFLGAAQVYSTFIPNYAGIVAPLTDLTKGTKTGPLTEWSYMHQQAFDAIKKCLATKPVMRSPERNRKFEVYSDASTIAVGGVLQQRDDEGNLHPIHYCSKKLTTTQQRYTTQEIEALALLYCLTQFFIYVHGVEFDVYTDHQALLNIKRTESPSDRVQRWSMYLQQFIFNIFHKPGILHVVADWLSRADMPTEPTRFEGLLAVRVLPASTGFDRTTWLKNQSRDDFCMVLVRSLQDGSVSPSPFILDDDKVLYHEEFHTGTLQLVVPVAMQDAILKLCHSAPTAAHAGVLRTQDRVFKSFFWPNWKHSVRRFVEACEKCQQSRLPKQRDEFKKATPRPIVAYRFNERISMDIQGPFVKTVHGNVYVLNIKDICTHFSVSLPLPETSALTVVTTFLNSWVQFLGVPQSIITDNGTNFTARLTREMWALLGTRDIHTTPYHPQANPVERFGRTLNAAIAKLVEHNQTDWDQYLGLVNFAYNTSKHSVTGVCPANAVFLEPPVTMMEFFHMLPINLELRTQWALKGREIIKDSVEQCRDAAFTRMLKSADQMGTPITEEPFGLNDIVWLADRHPLRDGRKGKHTLKHTGPYRVVSCNGHFSYDIKHVYSGAIYKAHWYSMTLAPPVTQRKYNLVGREGPVGGSETHSLTDHEVFTATVGTPPTTTSDNSYAITTNGDEDTEIEDEQTPDVQVISPFIEQPTNTISVGIPVKVSGVSPKQQSDTTRTTRSGRAVAVPHRYLSLFTSLQKVGKFRGIGEDPEDGRM